MATSSKRTPEPLRTVGWREWLHLPDLGISYVKAKIDTGARSSALHAFDIEMRRRGGVKRVHFCVHPLQRDSHIVVRCSAPLYDERWVTSSSGTREWRPVIQTALLLFGEKWTIELTLTSRDVMGFRMLLGREAIRGRCLVDPARSFLAGKKKKRKK